MSLTAGSICSGAGGLDLAVEAVFGCETVWQAEVDPNASQVLAARFAVPNLGDITAVDWSSVERVDVLSGGTPCQDMSSAGRRAGMRPGTRSGLWSAMAEAIDIIRPTVVVWENVRGALSACAHSDLEPCPGCVGDGRHEPVLRAPGRVLGDLADLGYDAAWRVVSAADVGACHRRDRLFLVAVAADAHDRAVNWQRARPELGQGGAARAAGLTLLPTVTTSDQNGAGAHGDGGADLRTAVSLLPTTTTSDALGSRNFRHDGTSYHANPDQYGPTLTDAVNPARWGRYAAAIARHEAAFGRPAPEPTETSAKGNPVLSARFAEWVMGWPDGWVTDLLPRRPALRACGNGVVPAQAAAAIRSLLPALLEAVPS